MKKFKFIEKNRYMNGYVWDIEVEGENFDFGDLKMWVDGKVVKGGKMFDVINEIVNNKIEFEIDWVDDGDDYVMLCENEKYKLKFI
jgi:hypothetical protein